MRCRSILTACLLASSVVFAGEDELVPGPAASGISASELLGHLRYFASDFMAGRDTGTEQERLASEYLAAHLVALGIEPGGDVDGETASYFAEFPLRRIQPVEDDTSLSLTYDTIDISRTVHLSAERDFVVSPRGLEPGLTSAPVVFVGDGTVNDERNDYDGLEVRGKFALIAMKAVDGGRRGRLSFSAIRALRNNAEEAGAVGLLVMRDLAPDAPGDADGERQKTFREILSWARRSFERSSLLLGDASPTDRDVRIPVVYMESAGSDFVRELGAMARGPVEGLTASFRYAAEITPIRARNVVGLIPGSDPELAREVVVYSAHYDHVGVDAKGQIFNGADDNGSGTCAILEVAQAFAESSAPRRTVAFLWVSGEEKGLLGSKWWVDHDTLPTGHTIVANINMDMVGRNEPGKVSICPSPEHEDHSSMGPILEQACAIESLTPVYDADRYYRRTDSYNFAKKGVPFVFLFSGEHEDYHRPTDTIEKIDSGKAASIARAAYHLGFELARRDDRPKIEKADAGKRADSKDSRQR